MPYVARKLSRAKWDCAVGFSENEIPADAVTLDLKTADNSLSFWECGDGTSDDLADVLAAVAAAGTRVDRMDIVWIDRNDLEQVGIDLRESQGRTPLADMGCRHLDAVRLDLSRLSSVAQAVASAIRIERWRRFSRAEVIRTLCGVVATQRLPLVGLEPEVRSEIEKHLGF
jgi:hypothetical protein